MRQLASVTLTDKSVLKPAGFYCWLKESGHILLSDDGPVDVDVNLQSISNCSNFFLFCWVFIQEESRSVWNTENSVFLLMNLKWINLFSTHFPLKNNSEFVPKKGGKTLDCQSCDDELTSSTKITDILYLNLLEADRSWN